MIPGIGEEYPEGRGHIGDEYVQYHRGHNRERRDINREDYTPFHIPLRYRSRGRGRGKRSYYLRDRGKVRERDG
jgi:hypothetical protein